MSRIGKQPINLPSGTTVSVEDAVITVKGAKGTLTLAMLPNTTLEVNDSVVTITNTTEDQAYRGLLRALLSNAVEGVTNGWKKDLELVGVGMRAALTGSNLTMNLGFSHPVVVEAPEGITFTVSKNVVSVSGIDLQQVGEVAAKIRKLRPPEPYKGKGIRYSNEKIRRKAGKTGKAGK